MNNLQRELENTVKDWVDKEFNYIQLEVINSYCESNNELLYDYIRNKNIRESVEEFLEEDYGYEKFREFSEQTDKLTIKDVKKYANLNRGVKDSIITLFSEEIWEEYIEFICSEKEDEIQEYIDEQENYPLWSTIFEYRSTPSEKELEDAISLGLGVIEGLDPFNPMLFSMSAGHSFYSSYWIPLYLSRFEYERKKYANVDYSMI